MIERSLFVILQVITLMPSFRFDILLLSRTLPWLYRLKCLFWLIIFISTWGDLFCFSIIYHTGITIIKAFRFNPFSNLACLGHGTSRWYLVWDSGVILGRLYHLRYTFLINFIHGNCSVGNRRTRNFLWLSRLWLLKRIPLLTIVFISLGEATINRVGCAILFNLVLEIRRNFLMMPY